MPPVDPTPENILKTLKLWDTTESAAFNLGLPKSLEIENILDPAKMTHLMQVVGKWDDSKDFMQNLEGLAASGWPKKLGDPLPADATPFQQWRYQRDRMEVISALENIASTKEGEPLVRNLRSHPDMPIGFGTSEGHAFGEMPNGHYAHTKHLHDDKLTMRPAELRLSTGTRNDGVEGTLSHELKHLDQMMKDNLDPAQRGHIVPPEEVQLFKRFTEADAQASATAVAYELKQKGDPAAWNGLMSDPHGPHAAMARAYEAAATADGAGDGAKLAAFREWFKTSRPRDYQTHGTLPTDYHAGEMIEGGARVGNLSEADLKRLGGYLSGADTNDPLFHRGLNSDPAEAARFAQFKQDAAAHAAPPPVDAPKVPVETPPKIETPAAVVHAAPDAPLPSRYAPGLNGSVEGAMGVVGGVQGTIGAINAAQQGDVAGVIVNGSNAATGIATTGVEIARGLGREVLPVIEKVLPKVNVAVTVADGIYQVATESGNFVETDTYGRNSLGRRGDRAAAVTTTALAGVGLAAAGVGTAGVVPVVVGVAVVGEQAIESRAAWRGVNEGIDREGQTGKRAGTEGQPAFQQYKHLVPQMVVVSQLMDDRNLSSPLPRMANGRLDVAKFSSIDMNDPKILAEFERALDMSIKQQKSAAAQNSSFLPQWMRSGSGVTAEADAKFQLAGLEAAKAELAMYRDEQKTPATTTAAARRSAPASPKA